MDERDFELIAVLEKTKNITRASEILFTSQSALSKRISAIEQELGVPLIVRSRYGVHFTPEGEEVRKKTEEAADILRRMREVLDGQRDAICGTIHIGVSVNYALYRFPETLSLYRKKYPQVNTHIITDHSRKLILQALNGEVDVAILRGEFQWSGKKILLTRERVCAIVSEADRGKSFHDLQFISRSTDSSFEREIARWFHENKFPMEEQGIHVDSITTCVEMVRRGIGWTIVPEICLEGFDGLIMPLSFVNGEPFTRSTYLMYMDSVAELPQVSAFITTITEIEKQAKTNE